MFDNCSFPRPITSLERNRTFRQTIPFCDDYSYARLKQDTKNILKNVNKMVT